MKKDVPGRQCLTIIISLLITPALAGGFFTTSTTWETQQRIKLNSIGEVGKVVPGRAKSRCKCMAVTRTIKIKGHIQGAHHEMFCATGADGMNGKH